MVDGNSVKRSYEDPCGVARALDLIGERWALLVVRELVFGPKRFTDLRRGLPTVSQNVLTHRLRELTAAGVVRRLRLGPPASAWGYELTDRGRELEPVLLQLARWGSRVPMVSGAALSVDALMFALKTTFDPAAAGDLRAGVELRIDGDLFHAAVGGARLTLKRGHAGHADAVLTTDAATLSELVFASRALEGGGAIRIDGDRAVVASFLRLFGVP